LQALNSRHDLVYDRVGGIKENLKVHLGAKRIGLLKYLLPIDVLFRF